MIKHDLRVGAVIQIGDATVRLDHKNGQRVLLVIDAPEHVKIHIASKNKVNDAQKQI